MLKYQTSHDNLTSHLGILMNMINKFTFILHLRGPSREIWNSWEFGIWTSLASLGHDASMHKINIAMVHSCQEDILKGIQRWHKAHRSSDRDSQDWCLPEISRMNVFHVFISKFVQGGLPLNIMSNKSGNKSREGALGFRPEEGASGEFQTRSSS